MTHQPEHPPGSLPGPPSGSYMGPVIVPRSPSHDESKASVYDVSREDSARGASMNPKHQTSTPVTQSQSQSQPRSDGKMAISRSMLEAMLAEWAKNGRPRLPVSEVYHVNWAEEKKPDTVEEAVLQEILTVSNMLMMSDLYHVMTESRRRAYNGAAGAKQKELAVDIANFVTLVHIWHHFYNHKNPVDFPWMKHRPKPTSGGPDDGYRGFLRMREQTAKARPAMPAASPQAKPASSSQVKPVSSPSQTKSTPAAPEANNAPPLPSHPPYGGYYDGHYGGHPAYSHPGYAYGATPMGPLMQQTGMPPQGYQQAYGYGYDYGVQQPVMPPQGHPQADGFGYGYGTQPEGGWRSADPQWRQ
ncbi:hypothetical protein CDEST_01255 [Colletotrichum destructivum]|uniref:Uncharacterized protein n=1 Tax=Colletotrichum destructivum TaxID=34406 RepID=A0AAX4HZH5_9PEZI|nr:hypothetical protein CDEST_01255 [Colletotrichum destructivum]